MGRLIDETDLMNLLYTLDDARHDLSYAIKKVPELSPVEAISKDQYENRLKADMVAMLEELDLQIDESAAYNLEVAKVQRLIRDRISKLKESKESYNTAVKE